MKTKKIIEEFDENGNLVKRTTIEEEGDEGWRYVPWSPYRTDEPWEPMWGFGTTDNSG